MTSFRGLIAKSVRGKCGNTGRFVTLKSGRVIFIQKGGYPAPHCGRKGEKGGSLPRSACAGAGGGPLSGKGLSAGETPEAGRARGVLEGSMRSAVGPQKGDLADFSDEERAELKQRVAQDIASRSGVTEEEAASFIRQWAESSTGEDMRSLMIQKDAVELFGLGDPKYIDSQIEKVRSTIEEQGGPRNPEDSPLMDSEKQQKILQAMYDSTQERLREEGITEVDLLRGVQMSEDSDLGKTREGDIIDVAAAPLSSWSASEGVATDFAVGKSLGGEVLEAGQAGILLRSTVPAERVFSLPTTGFGCLPEGEVVIVGGEGQAEVSYHTKGKGAQAGMARGIAADVAAGRKDFGGVEILQAENLPGVDLSGSGFRRTNFKEANLIGTNFSGADLRSANLSLSANSFADFSGANMRKANLYDADLKYTKLVGADLRGADMTGSWLKGADLLGADLRGADLRRAHGKRNVLNFEGIIWDKNTKGLPKSWKEAGERREG